MTVSTVPLSVLMLVEPGDRQAVIALNSVAWAAEILVITDQATSTILQKRVALPQLRIKTWPQPIIDFAQVRNTFTAQATHQWVFWLDSDEVVSAALAKEIQHHITKGHSQGYYVRRQDIFFGKTMKWGEVGQVRLLRLAKKNHLTFSRPVHEVAVLATTTQDLQNPLFHYAHSSIIEFFNSIVKYSHMEAQLRYQQGLRWTWLDTLVYPMGKFVYNYVIKLGFLDGMRGFIYALMMSLHSFYVRIYLYELSHPASSI